MKQIFLLLTLLISAGWSAFAQEIEVPEDTQGRSHVFIDYFYGPKDVSVDVVEAFRGAVMDALNDSRRVELTDVDTRSSLVIEKERRASEDIDPGTDMERMKLMLQEGANALIHGRVTQCKTARVVNSKGEASYTCTAILNLSVVDPATAKTLYTDILTCDASPSSLLGVTLESYATEGNAIAGAVKNCNKQVRKYVQEAFKIKGKVLEISETKKDEAKEVYISIGSSSGVTPGGRFNACLLREVAGRKSAKIIGELEVKDVEGEDLTLCKVKKGGKEILSAFNNGQVILVKSTAR